METQTDNLNTKLSAIDKALAAAQARKAAKESLSDASTEATSASKVKVNTKISNEGKAAEKAAKAAARAARQAQLKVEREARSAAKKAERSSGKPAHMKKVERAASKLPALTQQAELLFNEATANFSADQITAIALHLQHFNRVKATERALGQKVETGQTVRIIGGDPRFIGMTGMVSLARRIRCFVDVPGFKKPAYCFTSDVEVVSAPSAATGTDG